MRVIIGLSGATIVDPNEFTSFDFASDLAAVELGLAVTELGLGVVDADGEHVWFAIDGLIRVADPTADEDWRRRLRDMVDYASTHGWVDDTDRVKAHRARGA